MMDTNFPRVVADRDLVRKLRSFQPITSTNANQLTRIAQINDCSPRCWAMDDHTLTIVAYGRIWMYSFYDITSPPNQCTWFKSLSEPMHINVAISPNARMLAFNHSQERSVQVCDLITGEQIAVLVRPIGIVSGRDIVFSPDSRFLVTSGSRNQTSQVWDIKTRKLLFELPNQHKVAFNPSSTLVASGGSGMLCVWSLETGLEIARVDYRDMLAMNIAFNPDNRTIAICGETYVDDWQRPTGKTSKPVRVWNGANSGIQVELDGCCENNSWSIAYSPNGAVLMAGKADSWSGYNPVQIWDTEEYKAVATIRDFHVLGPANPARHIIFNPAGTIVSFDSGLASSVELWAVVD